MFRATSPDGRTPTCVGPPHRMQSGSRYCALRSIDRHIERTTRLSLSLDSSWIACKAVPISQAPSGRLQRNILASVAQFETDRNKQVWSLLRFNSTMSSFGLRPELNTKNGPWLV